MRVTGKSGARLAYRKNAMWAWEWPATSQGERPETGPFLAALRRNQPSQRLDLWFLASRTETIGSCGLSHLVCGPVLRPNKHSMSWQFLCKVLDWLIQLCSLRGENDSWVLKICPPKWRVCNLGEKDGNFFGKCNNLSYVGFSKPYFAGSLFFFFF